MFALFNITDVGKRETNENNNLKTKKLLWFNRFFKPIVMNNRVENSNTPSFRNPVFDINDLLPYQSSLKTI